MSEPVLVTPEVLAEHRLPDHGTSASKGERGCALLVGGTAETPGALVLAGVAALRAGAGKLQVATTDATAVALGIALPEARVVGAADGTLAERVADLLEGCDAVLVGPGTMGPETCGAVLDACLDRAAGSDLTVVVDAGALAALADRAEAAAAVGPRLVAMPNPGEVTHLVGDDVSDDPADALGRAVDRFGCTVSVRAADTWTAGPGTPTFHDRTGTVGMATSGSGDVLAGILTGYAARGTEPLAAVLWATHVHGTAGQRVAARTGAVGLLARELLDEIAPSQVALGA